MACGSSRSRQRQLVQTPCQSKESSQLTPQCCGDQNRVSDFPIDHDIQDYDTTDSTPSRTPPHIGLTYSTGIRSSLSLNPSQIPVTTSPASLSTFANSLHPNVACAACRE